MTMDLNSLETRNSIQNNQVNSFLDYTEKYESTKRVHLHEEPFRSKSLNCLNFKEFNKSSAKKNEALRANSKKSMKTNCKDSESEDQAKKLNKTQYYQNGTEIRNEDEIERLTGERIISDDGNEKRNNDKEIETDNLLFPGYVPVVFRYFRQESKPRIWCLKMITSSWFERMSMFIIILNCITLGMYQPCENIEKKCTSKRCFILECLDHSIHVFFTVEMMVKIMAMGFYGKNTYLAEAWNRLDFLIVMAG
jgi:hypothetical protein